MAKAVKSKARKPAGSGARAGIKSRTKTAAKAAAKPKAKRAAAAPARRPAPTKAAAKAARKAPAARAPLRMRVVDLTPADAAPKQQGGIREAVASFAKEAQFRNAVKRLLEAGFARTDLSILASHDSLEVAGRVPGYKAKPSASLMAGLTEEAGLLAPLQVAGFSALSGGPVAAAIAALLAAGIGALGLGDVIEKFAANRHSADYVAALKAGGILLWVRVTPEQEWKALMILGDAGGSNAHINWRAG